MANAGGLAAAGAFWTGLDEQELSRAKQCLTKSQRVDYILDLMLSAKWESSANVGVLADIWSIKCVSVSQMISEASRAYVRVCDPEQMRVRILASLDTIVAKSALDSRCAIEALKLQASIMGFANQRVEITGKDGGPLVFATLSEQELETRILAAAAEIRGAPERALLPAGATGAEVDGIPVAVLDAHDEKQR